MDRIEISYRRKDSTLTPCTLGDLTSRASRVFHALTSFPHGIDHMGSMHLQAASNRLGEDVVLSNVVGFDIKVFEPSATVDASGYVPGDTGYQANGTQVGAYVDLGFRGSSGIQFSGVMNPKSRLSGPPYFYDTWSWAYEHDGIDQDSANGTDTGSDGLDSNGDGIVDDANERDTMPPYPYPLRRIQIKLRIYEPAAAQIREVTIEESFMQ